MPPTDYPFAALGPALNVLALALMLVFCVVGLGLLLYLASLPGRVAVERAHPRAAAVRVAGWLGLPTGVGWVLAMVWAYASPSGANAEAQVAELENAVAALELAAGRAPA